MIEFAAPGKAVIWGEYAVLAGAPALVMAVDRYAHARIEPGGTQWHIVASGFTSEERLNVEQLRGLSAPGTGGAGAVLRAAVSAFEAADLPMGAEVSTDTRSFHAGENKLGIGSSAAVCTATCAALAVLLDQPFTFERALAAHQALQGKAGSGLDVAAACEGGLIRFQQGQATSVTWPEDLHYRFVWAGHSAKTTDHLARFSTWRAGGKTAALNALCQASENLFETTDLAAFRNYVDRLQDLDVSGDLGIYGAAHQRLSKLANRAQVVYKPCGAGGGDIGIAVSDDATALNSFTTLANQHSFLTLDLEIAAHGVHRIRDQRLENP